ncbi:hypothetical protein IW140_000414 [Coemansia sp. RSA 1813]|nr:hypothetical protein EV178_000627 [Coemansia sp. RSA 1646]KAJ1773285.1 hypothetical protein LPJ74_000796 [Coemansia sp. RSA 1843]KAJ2092753.1 hypothetical protein IW138_000848 [Coemansia sp. RSA 986]KAJ2217748.1 hypothetical protein EV179_000233 [Coemansia sp. RSA 487]KAJ2573015.1 hypothetical protein IW140_000414 [Coemansia sp. RSA 1813]
MTGKMHAGPVDAVQATASHPFGVFASNQGPSEPAAETHDTTDSYPSRCESPLLPMGQSLSHQIGVDRLSQQRGQVSNRQSQVSMLRKDYAIHDEEETQEPSTAGTKSNSRRVRQHMNRPRMTMPRAKSYRIHTSGGHASPVRDLSSKLKSACRKLNPKRLAKSAHLGQEDDRINDENHCTHGHRLGASSNGRGDHHTRTGQAQSGPSSPTKLS